MNVPELKEKFLSSIDTWFKGRVDDMLKDNPAMAIPSVYLKRGCHNILCKNKEVVGKGFDNAALFFADENGNINASTVLNDAMSVFKSMEETSFDMGIVKGVVGKGNITINLPDNVFMNIIFGNKKAIVFNEKDFMELKSLLLS